MSDAVTEDYDDGTLGAAIRGIRSSLKDIEADIRTYPWYRRWPVRRLVVRRLRQQIERLEGQIDTNREDVLRRTDFIR